MSSLRRTSLAWQLALVLVGSAGCEPSSPPIDASAPIDGGSCTGLPASIVLPSDPHTVAVVGRSRNEDCSSSIELESDRIVEVWVDGAEARLDAALAAYHGPRRLTAGSHPLSIVGDGAEVTLHVRDLGPPAGALSIARSLTWTDPALLDDPSVVGLERVMRTVSGGAHPGPMLDAFFRRFGTTAHSERLGPQRILEDQIAAQGADPLAWDLDAFPFRVTGVHNRIDLADGAHCGELRVSLASTHPLHQPFHVILLFRQEPRAEDRRPDGSAHCAATALGWARLSEGSDEAFRTEARGMLDETLTPARFLVLETVEFIISPWEWRQWFLEPNPDPLTRDALPERLENRPLFQTVDTPRLNSAGPDRDAFLAWVEDNADAIDARRAPIPERFRSASVRVNDGVPWIPLDLGGIGAATTYPTLRQSLEIVGCPACHATDADFVQTLPDRSFSPFYVRELDARALHLRALTEGTATSAPFGPLQADPRLPP